MHWEHDLQKYSVSPGQLKHWCTLHWVVVASMVCGEEGQILKKKNPVNLNGQNCWEKMKDTWKQSLLANVKEGTCRNEASFLLLLFKA